MLKLTPHPTFEVPVDLTVPGQALPETIRVTFKHKSPDGLSAWFAQYAGLSVKEALLEVIDRWSGIVDEKGAEVKFSAESLDHLLHGYGTAGRELVGAYGRALTESRVKN